MHCTLIQQFILIGLSVRKGLLNCSGSTHCISFSQKQNNLRCGTQVQEWTYVLCTCPYNSSRNAVVLHWMTSPWLCHHVYSLILSVWSANPIKMHRLGGRVNCLLAFITLTWWQQASSRSPHREHSAKYGQLPSCDSTKGASSWSISEQKGTNTQLIPDIESPGKHEMDDCQSISILAEMKWMPVDAMHRHADSGAN